MVDLGDFGGDFENMFLEAFDNSGLSLGSVKQDNEERFIGMTTLSIWATEISYVLFGGVGFEYEGEGPFHNSLFADNLKISTIPIPAALPLFGTGLAILGFVGWRRKRKAEA